MQKKFSEIKKGDRVRMVIDHDIFGTPMYEDIIAGSDFFMHGCLLAIEVHDSQLLFTTTEDHFLEVI